MLVVMVKLWKCLGYGDGDCDWRDMMLVMVINAVECRGVGDDYNKSSIYAMMSFYFLIIMAEIVILLMMVRGTVWLII